MTPPVERLPHRWGGVPQGRGAEQVAGFGIGEGKSTGRVVGVMQAPLWGTGSALAPLLLPIQCHLLEKGCETQAHPPVIGINN